MEERQAYSAVYTSMSLGIYSSNQVATQVYVGKTVGEIAYVKVYNSIGLHGDTQNIGSITVYDSREIGIFSSISSMSLGIIRQYMRQIQVKGVEKIGYVKVYIVQDSQRERQVIQVIQVKAVGEIGYVKV